MERTCARCEKIGTGFQRCGRCKEVYYCSRECQSLHWSRHKEDCIPPDKKPPKPAEEVVVEFVECETYEQCRDLLIKHPELINKELSDEMFTKGYLALREHPPHIGARFIRNAQMLQYLLDIRKASGGQQDISLFFGRILDENNPEYRKNFETEYTTLVKRILQRIKEKKKEEKAKKKAEKEKAAAEGSQEGASSEDAQANGAPTEGAVTA